MIYIIAIQALALAACLWKIGHLWFSREDARREAAHHSSDSDVWARKFGAEKGLREASETHLRALLHEAAGLLMDERHRSKPRTGDSRKTDNYGAWSAKRDELVKRIGGAT